ncbi:MAG: hypothetical protein IMF19_05520, partial [Proteobacteria bacterium]|nr:hypothetical protein [Pseudomonadota bacterium]
MRAGENLDASEMPKKYPNIAQIFTKEWFESEFRKKKEEMHLLARDLLLIDYEEYESARLHIEHLEDYLATMQDEIAQKMKIKKHFYEGLRNKDFYKYRSTLAEIEIASLFKNMGFQVQLEPPIPDSKKNGDIKISDAETEVFIEVRTIRGKNGEILDKWEWVETRRMEFHRPIDLENKIVAEIHGLSGFYPGIVVLYRDQSLINDRDIE